MFAYELGIRIISLHKHKRIRFMKWIRDYLTRKATEMNKRQPIIYLVLLKI